MPRWLRDYAGRMTATAVLLLGFGSLVWFVVGYYLDSWHRAVRAVTRKFFVREMFPDANPLHWTPFTYLVLFLILLFVVLVIQEMADFNEKDKNFTVAISIFVVSSLLAGGYAVSGWWNNDKDEAVSYASGTTFIVEDSAMSHIPAALRPLIQGGERTKSDDCLYTTDHDVPSCIKRGTLPFNWVERSASLTGAQIVMSRTSGSIPKTAIMNETLTYVNAEKSWTAIRNGQVKQPLNGVVTWDGVEKPRTCQFTGRNKISYAFGGNWGQNLDDTLAKHYPHLLYSHGDMSGFCRGTDGDVTKRTPVIVIPVVEQDSFGRRTTLRAGGILVITGTPSGEPKIEHLTSVKAGELPVPVYPLSLVAKQRDMTQWAAGRANKNRTGFGYESSDVAAQKGNTSEYLLKDADSGRLFWVTPQKPRSTDSQLLTSYSLTPADEVKRGKLNEQRIHVLPDEDPRIVNVDDMEARVGEAIRTTNPGFFTGSKPGSVVEFLPINATTWQAFAELNGRVVYRITIPTDARIVPTVQPLDGSATTSDQPEESATICTKKAVGLTKPQLADCIEQFARELAGRK